MYFNPRHLYRADNYEIIHAYWAQTTPWRNGDPNVKPLGSRRQKQCVVLKSGDDIICRYYNTDILTVHPDDSLTIIPHQSMSSKQFAHEVLPHGVMFTYESHLGYFLLLRDAARRDWYAWKAYPIDAGADGVVVRPGENRGCWTPVSGLGTVEVPHVDRRRAKKALAETRYNEFRAFAHAYKKLARDVEDSRPYWQRCNKLYSNYILLDTLEKGPEAWMTLLDKTFNLETLLADIRAQIYNETDVVRMVKHTHFDNLHDVYCANKLARKNG